MLAFERQLIVSASFVRSHRMASAKDGWPVYPSKTPSLYQENKTIGISSCR
jgi:hypothetical protein